MMYLAIRNRQRAPGQRLAAFWFLIYGVTVGDATAEVDVFFYEVAHGRTLEKILIKRYCTLDNKDSYQ